VSYVGNLAEGMVQAAQREGASGEVYVLADEVLTWRELIDTIAEVFGKPAPRGSIPFALAWSAAVAMETLWRTLPLKGAPALTRYRIGLFRGDLVFSSAKARRELGFAPAVSLREGLVRTRDWCRAQGL
jgi:dihydroflavonol-4-reductase